MKVCIPCQSPGGPEAVVSAPFEESEILDYYEVHQDGNFEHVAQMRQCAGGCSDPVESITRRGTEVVIAAGMTPATLGRFRRAGVKVLRADNPSVRSLIDSLVMGGLQELGSDKPATHKE